MVVDRLDFTILQWALPSFWTMNPSIYIYRLQKTDIVLRVPQMMQFLKQYTLPYYILTCDISEPICNVEDFSISRVVHDSAEQVRSD